jgi:hypothetical protein
MATVESHGLGAQPRMLYRIYRLGILAAIGRLATMPGARVHAVRETKAAGSAQVVRGDGDKKCRCMLSKKGAGFRLHYWEGRDGGIELDAVLVESEV